MENNDVIMQYCEQDDMSAIRLVTHVWPQQSLAGACNNFEVQTIPIASQSFHNISSAFWDNSRCSDEQSGYKYYTENTH